MNWPSLDRLHSLSGQGPDVPSDKTNRGRSIPIRVPHKKGSFISDVRNLLWSGQITRGQHLSEARLAEVLGYSRTPAREGIAYLASLGIVVASCNRRGFMITPFSRQQVIEFYSTREVLEGLAARFATANVTREDLLRIEQALVRFDAAEAPVQRGLANNAFHQEIYHAANNRYLLDCLIGLEEILSFVRRPGETATDRRDATRSEHWAIMDMLKAQDAIAAEAAARRHVALSLHARLSEMTIHGETGDEPISRRPITVIRQAKVQQA